ncbi:hypothetical protein ACIPY6_03145 [Streptomyces sp. NPDC090054]|uniref:hypothetical protein n=1 Tax=Streptomyces sp. NPDC090054 TaxID=3365933 RepID=UPI00381103FA
MPVSGRRYQQLQRDNAELLKDNGEILRELRDVTAERDALRDLICGLSQRNRELLQRPLNRGEEAIARQLRYSEEGRAVLAEELVRLQAINESLDVPVTSRPAVAA